MQANKDGDIITEKFIEFAKKNFVEDLEQNVEDAATKCVQEANDFATCKYSSSLALKPTADLRLHDQPPPQNFQGHISNFHTGSLLRGGVANLTPNPQPGGPGPTFITPGTGYPQALGTHFSRLLRHVWATAGLFFNPGHHTGQFVSISQLNISRFLLD